MTHGTSGSNGVGLRILVAGAGIAGLGAARALRQGGFAADVVERDPALAPTGAGIYLPATPHGRCVPWGWSPLLPNGQQ